MVTKNPLLQGLLDEEPKLAFYNALNWLPFWQQTSPFTQGGKRADYQGVLSSYGYDVNQPGGGPKYAKDFGAFRGMRGQEHIGRQLNYHPLGQGGNVKQFYQDQFQNIFNEYLGQLGGQVQAGKLPSDTFADFAGQYPFMEKFYAQAPGARGEANRRFAPPVQYGY